MKGIGNEAFWDEVRKQFVIDDAIVNLNNGAVGPQPLPVQEAHIDLYRLSNKAPSHHMWGAVDDKRESLRQNLAMLMAIKGDMETAGDLARMDLDENQVSRNLEFFGQFQGD